MPNNNIRTIILVWTVSLKQNMILSPVVSKQRRSIKDIFVANTSMMNFWMPSWAINEILIISFYFPKSISTQCPWLIKTNTPNIASCSKRVRRMRHQRQHVVGWSQPLLHEKLGIKQWIEWVFLLACCWQDTGRVKIALKYFSYFTSLLVKCHKCLRQIEFRKQFCVCFCFSQFNSFLSGNKILS